MTNTTQLDGFVITKGNANGTTGLNKFGGGIIIDAASPVVQNCTIVDNRAGSSYGGAGAHVDGRIAFPDPSFPNSNATFIDCGFFGNQSEGVAGGMCNRYGTTTLIGCVLSGNTAGSQGGGLHNVGGSGSMNVTNCTIVNNNGTNFGGGINNTETLTVRNSIIRGNTASTGPQLYNSAGTMTLSDSNIEQGSLSGTNLINTDALFIDANGDDNIIGTADDNLRIAYNSPSRNEGDNAYVVDDAFNANNLNGTTDDTPDCDREQRIRNTDVDQGAYENHASSTCCADINSSGCVNVDDLLAVINSWGFGGVADISPACSGDGVVDVNDLLAVINSWGTDEGGCGGACDESSMPQSVEDCMDYCSGAFPGDPEGYNACLIDCVDALCKADLIDCD